MMSRSEKNDNWRLWSTAARVPDYFTGLHEDDRRLKAVIYAEGGLTSTLGKTTHGLLRYSPRYQIVAVIDSTFQKSQHVDPRVNVNVPVVASIHVALRRYPDLEVLVIGIAPTGVSKVRGALAAAADALRSGLAVHNGLHLFFSEVPALVEIVNAGKGSILDIRKPPDRPLRIFTGAIASLKTPRLLVTGQDAAIGKRTTCVRLAQQLAPRFTSRLIGTGQTAWLQAFPYGVRLDALPIDFASGEVEGAVLQAARESSCDLLIVEGQGSLLNPGYGPDTLALLAGSRPTLMVYVAAAKRKRYDDFPRYRLPDVQREIQLLEEITRAPVVGIVINDGGDGTPADGALAAGRPMSVGVEGDLSAIVNAIAEAIA